MSRTTSTRTGLVSLSLLLVATATWAGPSAAAEDPAGLRESTLNGAHLDQADCRRCHTCSRPTAEHLCLLHPCARHAPANAAADLGPRIVILDELEHEYLPVPFDHAGHARMAEMGGGCRTCHHHTPEGRPQPKCKTCHDASAEGTDIFKPGLKGAYHQQCLNCHREWIDERNCEVCHRPKAGQSPGRETASSTRDDILGQLHPPIPQPGTDLYGGDRDRSPNAERVVFRHREHVERFGLNCVDCHHESSCGRCHTRRQTASAPAPGDRHRPCIRCHKNDMDLAARSAGKCETCHWKPGQPQPRPFSHDDTGWLLKGYHLKVACRDCHQTLPFSRRSSDCTACHAKWSPGEFDHRITGQSLDETHAELDCEDCHVNRAFDRPPVCTECHDPEDDGIAFPEKRPGPYRGFQAHGKQANPASRATAKHLG